MNKIHMDKKHLNIILDILQRYVVPTGAFTIENEGESAPGKSSKAAAW